METDKELYVSEARLIVVGFDDLEISLTSNKNVLLWKITHFNFNPF